MLLGFVDSDDKPSLFGVHLSPQAIPTTLFFVTLYLLYWYWLGWSFQPDAIKPRIRNDFFLTVVPTILVLLGYLIGHLAYQFIELTYLPILIGVGATIVALIMALYSFQQVRLISAEREKSDLRTYTIKDRIQEPGWRLNFNPHFPNKSKPISFNDDGTVGEGHNVNESVGNSARGWKGSQPLQV